MFLSFSTVPLLIFFCIFFSSSLTSATIFYYKNLETIYSDCIHKSFISRELNYASFAVNLDVLPRACGTRLLTSNARVVAVQQNIHEILKLLFGDYHLTEYFLESYENGSTMQLKEHDKSDAEEIDIFYKKFIIYNEDQKCLAVAKVVQTEQEDIRYFKYYSIKTRLPLVEALYRKMILKNIDLDFVLRLLPRIINLYEINFKFRSPDAPILTKSLNDFIKEFIWKHCRKNGNIKYSFSLTMERLSKKLRKNLSAKLHTVKQGKDGQLYAHLIGKPCTVYEIEPYLGICYTKKFIENMEQWKIPVCPSATNLNSCSRSYYCIYTYNIDKNNKLRIDDSKEYKQEATLSLFTKTVPLMKVPDGTILSTYVVFDKKCLVNFLAKRQRYDSSKKEFKGTDKYSEDVCYSSMISDEQLHIFMKHFTEYLYTDANHDLFEIKSLCH